MGYFPHLEVLVRVLYWRFDFLHKTAKKAINKRKNDILVNPKSFENLKNRLTNIGIKKGDILIVHSSSDGLATAGKNEKAYIDMLLDLVGEEGTLVFPAFPLYRSHLKGVEAMNESDDLDNALIYNADRARAWTGMLPNVFLNYDGVVRSPFPVNPLAAKGARATLMMEKNLDTDLAHGKNSAWEYCVNNNAKVLFLGLEAAHSCTVIHVAEDLMDEKWPVKNWYRKQKYIVKRNGKETEVIARQRYLFWARYITQQYMGRKLKKENLLQSYYFDDILVEFIPDSKRLTDFVINRANNYKLFYKVPIKYKKYF